ncbi:hypothetical protein BK659_12750 [Pseudomonas brassicacearum]|uniref:Uncharacterized protein n=1 Tax=Pseudomonas brassicacearum TaxID=930166 RepID=A0A423H7D5_9PSED|nr:hypothetical protein BK659_12750 [Pseudomonas brassicacearum]
MDQCRQILYLSMQFDMPVKISDVAEKFSPGTIAKIRYRLAHQVQANADHAYVSHVIQQGTTNTWLQHDHSSQPLRHLPQRRQQVAIVDTQKTRLHQYAMTQTMGAQVIQILRKRGIVVRGVAPCNGQLQPPAKDMSMGIDASDRC